MSLTYFEKYIPEHLSPCTGDRGYKFNVLCPLHSHIFSHLFILREHNIKIRPESTGPHNTYIYLDSNS